MQKCLGIIGVGELGQSLVTVASNNGKCVLDLWDKEEGKVPDQKHLHEVTSNAAVLLLCIPSWTLRDSLKDIASDLKPATAVISLAKGLEKDTHKTMLEVLEDELPQGQPTALLSGPMLAEELEVGQSGAGVVAGVDTYVYELLTEIFSGSPLRLEYSADTRGVALAGVLKNIYAIGLSVVINLESGDNARGWYVQAAANEMATIIERLDGKPTTAYTAAGLADLVTTGHSPHSQNYAVGKALVCSGHDTSITSEGTRSLPEVEALLGDASGLPLFTAVKSMVIEGQSAEKVVAELFRGK